MRLRVFLPLLLVLFAGCTDNSRFAELDEKRHGEAQAVPGLTLDAHIYGSGNDIVVHGTANNEASDLHIAGPCANGRPTDTATPWRVVIHPLGSSTPVAGSDWPCSKFSLLPFPSGQSRTFEWRWDATQQVGDMSVPVEAGQYVIEMTFEAYVPGDGDGAPTGQIRIECRVTIP